MHKHADAQITRVGVGFDGGPESRAALSLARALAREAGVKLVVRGVVDDRMPAVGWAGIGGALVLEDWDEVIEQEVRSLREEAQTAAKTTGADVEVEVLRGRPAEALLKFSGDDELLVIGSRRWGAAARLMLGSTGEALLHDASCPVIAVPRPQQ
jgi:nucleotide-binding universal stress UspA family protein